MDIDMPIMNGIEATKTAIEKYPNIRILVLSMFGDENYYNQMVEAGVKGFLLKTSDIKELENAIHLVNEGKSYFSSELLQSIISNFNTKNSNYPDTAKLTEREMDVLKLICKGLTNEKIAEQLHISPKTVKGHRANLLDKTGCNNSTSMVIYSIKHKIIEI
jgi:DNA-binding NarL/FixJ family response regulator